MVAVVAVVAMVAVVAVVIAVVAVVAVVAVLVERLQSDIWDRYQNHKICNCMKCHLRCNLTCLHFRSCKWHRRNTRWLERHNSHTRL